MLNSVNINFVAFSRFLENLEGQIFTIFVITVTACEVAVALAILVTVVRNKATLEVDEIAIMKG
jgi:NADH-quinone oxidoreductase subunit K